MKNQTRRIRRSVNQRRLTKKKSFKQEGGAGDKGIAFFATRKGGKLKKFGSTKEVFVIIGLNVRHGLVYYEMDAQEDKFRIDRLRKQTTGTATEFKMLKNFIYHYYGDDDRGKHPKTIYYFANDTSYVGSKKEIDLKIPIEMDGTNVNINDVTFTLNNLTLAKYVYFLLSQLCVVSANLQICEELIKKQRRIPSKTRSSEGFHKFIDFLRNKRAQTEKYYQNTMTRKHMLIIPKMNANIDKENKFGLNMIEKEVQLSKEANALVAQIKDHGNESKSITLEDIRKEPDPEIKKILEEVAMDAEFERIGKRLEQLQYEDLERRLAELGNNGRHDAPKAGGGTRRRKRRLSNKKKRSTRRKNRKMTKH